MSQVILLNHALLSHTNHKLFTEPIGLQAEGKLPAAILNHHLQQYQYLNMPLHPLIFCYFLLKHSKAFTSCWKELTALLRRFTGLHKLMSGLCKCSPPPHLPPPGQDMTWWGDRGVRVWRLHWYQSSFITPSSGLWSRSQTAQESYSPVWQWGGGMVRAKHWVWPISCRSNFNAPCSSFLLSSVWTQRWTYVFVTTTCPNMQ